MPAPRVHTGYAVSQRKRKLIEQVFGWMKTVGGLRKLRHRGGARVDWIVTFSAGGLQPDPPAHTPGDHDVTESGDRHDGVRQDPTRAARPSPHISVWRTGNALTSYFFIGLLEVEPVDVALVEQHRRPQMIWVSRTSIVPSRPASRPRAPGASRCCATSALA